VIPWDWVAAAGTISSMYLLRRKRWQGFLIGLVNQVPWLMITWENSRWGFIPINLCLMWIYVRGLIEWRRADSSAETR